MLNFKRIVSATTRSIRIGEVDGIDYHFLKLEDFDKFNFIEKTSYNGTYYGIKYDEVVDDKLNIVVVNQDGARALIKEFKDRTIFTILLEVSDETLKERYFNRESNNKADLEEIFLKRLQKDNENFKVDFKFDLKLNNEDVNFTNNFKKVLDIALSLKKGDILCLIGKTGSGKTFIERQLIEYDLKKNKED